MRQSFIIGKISIKEPSTDVEVVIEDIETEFEGTLAETTGVMKAQKECMKELARDIGNILLDFTKRQNDQQLEHDEKVCRLHRNLELDDMEHSLRKGLKMKEVKAFLKEEK